MRANLATKSVLQRRVSPGLHMVSVPRRACEEHFITAFPVGNEPPEVMFARVAKALRGKKAQVISQDVLGMASRNGAGMGALADALGEAQWPVTWIEGLDQPGLTGTHLWAVTGVPVKPVYLGERVAGSVFSDGEARYCRLGDLRPADGSGSRPDQARWVFQQMEAGLAQAGMDFSHVVRTWLYLDQILDWYGELNQVRNDFFSARRIFNGLVPASTGIAGSHASNSALVAGLLAVEPQPHQVRAYAVPSPLQCPAVEYGSSFSRAVEVAGPDHRRLLVSGTASIGPEGGTRHVGDMKGQVALTMEVVRAILESRHMGWGDVTRAIAYLKSEADVPVFHAYCSAHGLTALPMQGVRSDICRPDLLFEIELDALRLLE